MEAGPDPLILLANLLAHGMPYAPLIAIVFLFLVV
jgi:hypothetical protein